MSDVVMTRLLLMAFLIGCILVTDITSRRIPNILTVPFTLIGFGLHAFEKFPNGLSTALIGFLVGFGLFLIPYLIDAMGAGDVKLMAALGALSNVYVISYISLFTALAGGVIIMVVRMRSGEIKTTFKRVKQLLVFYFFGSLYFFTKEPKFYSQKEDHRLEMTNEKTDYIPYGAAIACGTMITIGLFVWGNAPGLYF